MKVSELFSIHRGSGEYYSKVAFGNTPLVSATTVNNGVIGFVDLEPAFKAGSITIERVSGHAFVQPEDFATVLDDISVLIPLQPLDLSILYYVAATINTSKWRFSYGRKLSATRLNKLISGIEIQPVADFDINLNRFSLSTPSTTTSIQPVRFEEHLITDYFDLQHGDFHSLDALDVGDINTVSRITYNNGIVGRYEQPEGANIYNPLTLTVSTTSGDAFLQLDKFMATDNVVILTPKNGETYETHFLVFIQAMINRTKWRYYYGRQCYKTRFSKTKIYMPITDKSKIDSNFIKNTVLNAYGWNELSSVISNSPL